MNLSSLSFDSTYNSYDNDVINEFYIKALSNASTYNRVSAYFSSKILALYSKGIEQIYIKGGKINFIFSQQLDENDFQLMMDGYKQRAEELLINNFNSTEVDSKDIMRLSNLAFLIEQNVVDIKIAFTKSGILHDKFGLISDDYGNVIFFRGSNNETVASVESNHERFEVSCNWNEEHFENKKIVEAIDTFDDMWNDKAFGMRVLDIPEIVKKEIIKFSKNKLIVEDEILYSDVVLADLNDSNQLVVLNKLKQYYNFENDYYYRNYIKNKVESNSDTEIIFVKDLSYVIIEDIISKFQKSADTFGYEFVVSARLRNFIRESNLQIDARKELGILIKKKDSLVLENFNKFKLIVSDEMERKLRDKQMWDAFFITEMVKSANYSVPGAGKTSIVYGAFSFLNSQEINKIDKLIVVGPKNSFKSWKDEFTFCFGDKKKLNLLNIQDDKYRDLNSKISALKLDSQNNNLILINYDILDSLKDTLSEIINSRTMLVYDEVHKVKSVSGVWAQAALHISKKARFKVILTGTPIPNSYVDLYTPLNILFTDEYKTFFKFTPSDLKSKNDNVTAKINESIYPFFCRTTKRDLKIPAPNNDEKVLVSMNDMEEKLFSAIRRVYAKNGLALYIRLMQAANNPKLLLKALNDEDLKLFLCSEDEDYVEDDNYTLIKERSKIDAFDSVDLRKIIDSMDMTSKFWSGIDLVERLVKEGKKVVVWGIFVDTINRINSELSNRGINSRLVSGGTILSDREQLIDQFINGKYDVLVTNPHTLAESVSLHSVCHDAVYFEYSFNLTHMLQSRDRINRLGLADNQYTQYYYMFLCNDNFEEDSIDLRTYDRLKEKEEIMIKSIEGELIECINFDMLEDVKKILNEY